MTDRRSPQCGFAALPLRRKLRRRWRRQFRWSSAICWQRRWQVHATEPNSAVHKKTQTRADAPPAYPASLELRVPQPKPHPTPGCMRFPRCRYPPGLPYLVPRIRIVAQPWQPGSATAAAAICSMQRLGLGQYSGNPALLANAKLRHRGLASNGASLGKFSPARKEVRNIDNVGSTWNGLKVYVTISLDP